MANRDYFARPMQGNGRDHHGYGHGVGPIMNDQPPRDPWMRWTLIGAALIVAYFIFQFLR